MKYLIVAALVVAPAVAAAQADPGCDAANALLGALLKSRSSIPCKPSVDVQSPSAQTSPLQGQDSAPVPQASGAPSTFTRRGRSVDTPENLTLVLAKVKARLETMDPSSGSDITLLSLCATELRPLQSMRDVIGSGFEQLQGKCEAAARQEVQQYRERAIGLQQQRRQAQVAEAARAQATAAEKEQEEERVMAAELRAGRRQPVNCAQWFAAKGQDARALVTPVTEIAFQRPQGTGPFEGRVEKIEGQTLLISDQPIIRMRHKEQGYLVVNIDSKAQVFNGSRIKLNSVVNGFATQTGTRSLRMTDGSSKQSPILEVVCLNHVMQ